MIGLVGTYPYHTLIVLFFGYILFKRLKKGTNGNPNRLPLPPGPKGYPLLANLFDVPIDKPWLGYDEWSKTYGKLFLIIGLLSRIFNSWDILGNIIYFNVLGQRIVVLSDLKRTSDIFEKRSSNYSDRIQTPMLELYVSDPFYPIKIHVCFRMGWNTIFGFLPYGVQWRKQRKSFHEYFQPSVVNKYQPIQRREAQAFLRRLLVTPDNFFHHIRQ